MRLPRRLRGALRPLASRLPVMIVSGENRGRWWNLASAGSGYASGRRAPVQMRLLASLIEPGDCVWDVGAHHGYMTLFAARSAAPHGRVFAFEPSAMNHRQLERHLRWNGVRGVTAVQLALSDFNGRTKFGGAGTSKTYAMGGGSEVVSVSRGDTLIERGICVTPDVMKIDVEGAEGAVLRGMGEALSPSVRLLVALHSRASFNEVSCLLGPRGFRLVASRALLRSLGGPWMGDPDLLALGPLCGWKAGELHFDGYLCA